MKKQYIAIWKATKFGTEQVVVELMVKSGVYLMVRRKRCMPFVVHESDYICDHIDGKSTN